MEIKFCSFCGNELVLKEVGDEGKLPFCNKCNIPFFNNPVCSILAAVINDNDEVLLLKQNYVSTTNWGLVAGYLKVGENLEQAVAREIKEETGIEISDVKYISSYCYEKKEMIMIGYLARAKNIDFNLDSNEVDDIMWENMENAINLFREGSIAQKHFIKVLDYTNINKYR